MSLWPASFREQGPSEEDLEEEKEGERGRRRERKGGDKILSLYLFFATSLLVLVMAGKVTVSIIVEMKYGKGM